MKVEKKPAQGQVEFRQVKVGQTFEERVGNGRVFAYVRIKECFVSANPSAPAHGRNAFCLSTDIMDRFAPFDVVFPVPYKVVPDVEE